MDAGAEIQRLESNHAELLLHQETLAMQLQTKKDQLKQIRAALGDCRALLASHEQAQRQPAQDATADVAMATS